MPKRRVLGGGIAAGGLAMVAALATVVFGPSAVPSASASAPAANKPVAAAAPYYLATTEQVSNDVIVFNQAATNWNAAAAIKWRWSAPSGRGWANLSDVKLRSTSTGNVLLVAASGGNVGVVRVSDKHLLWQAPVGGNPHAIERITGGAIAVASSTGYLRLYAPGGALPLQTFRLAGAHGVLYEPTHRVLWALGDKKLVPYSVTGSGASTRLRARTGTIAISGLGHDLQPISGQPGIVWVTDTNGAYSINTVTRSVYRVSSTKCIKGFASQPSGVRARTKCDNRGARTWASPSVEFFSNTGRHLYTRTRAGAEFYKVRMWTPGFA